MMAKIVKGGSFGGTVKYVLDEDGENGKEVTILDFEGLGLDMDFSGNEGDGEDGGGIGLGIGIGQDVPDGRPVPDVTVIVKDFEMQASGNSKVELPVRHFILSYSPMDLPKLSDETMRQDAVRYLNKMGYGDTQYLIVRHSEKDNPHVHIIANAVGNDFRKIPDGNDRKRSVQICRDITLEREYTWGSHKSCSELEVFHNPIDQVKYEMSRKIVDAIWDCKTVLDLPEQLADRGIECTIKRDGSDRPVGISFSTEATGPDGMTREYHFAGSKIDKRFSFSNLSVACEMQYDMASLVKCAYQLTKDCEGHKEELTAIGRETLQRLQQEIRIGEKEQWILERKILTQTRQEIKTVALTLVTCGPVVALVPALFFEMKKSGLTERYGHISDQILMVRDKIASAREIMGMVKPFIRQDAWRQTKSLSELVEQPAQNRSRGMRR